MSTVWHSTGCFASILGEVAEGEWAFPRISNNCTPPGASQLQGVKASNHTPLEFVTYFSRKGVDFVVLGIAASVCHANAYGIANECR